MGVCDVASGSACQVHAEAGLEAVELGPERRRQGVAERGEPLLDLGDLGRPLLCGDVKRRLDLALLSPIRNPELLRAYGATLGGNEDRYSLQPEFSVGYLVTKNVVVGAEYRFMRNKLVKAGNVALPAAPDGLRSEDWKDIFIAWAPTKNVSLTLAYVDLGVIVPATTASRKQTGYYLSAQVAF